jgi:hypothetical protein
MEQLSYYYEIKPGHRVVMTGEGSFKKREVVVDPAYDRYSYIAEHDRPGYSTALYRASSRVWEESSKGVKYLKTPPDEDPLAKVEEKTFFWAKLSGKSF